MAKAQRTLGVVRSIAGWVKASAVRVGELWLPSKQVEPSLARFTQQLFCLTHHDEYPYAFLGSATGVRFKGRFFLVWCQHQTKGYQPDDVTIPIESGKTLISGSQFLFVRPDDSNKEEDYVDLCAMEFIPEKYSSPNLDTVFFSVKEDECWQGNTDAKFIVFGFPTESRIVEYEKPHVHVSQVVTSARYDGKTSSQGLHRLEMTRTTSFSSDGLSGGPVYHLAKDSKGFFVGLAGTIMRGSATSDYLHFLDARVLLMLLNRYLTSNNFAQFSD
jgi:hypothetical protein